MTAPAHVFLPPDEAEVIVSELYVVSYLKADGTQGYGCGTHSDEPLSALIGLLELAKADLLERRSE